VRSAKCTQPPSANLEARKPREERGRIWKPGNQEKRRGRIWKPGNQEKREGESGNQETRRRGAINPVPEYFPGFLVSRFGVFSPGFLASRFPLSFAREESEQ
jgi:hypothetical protein